MSKRVLIVDDEEAIVELLAMRLEDEGFEVRVAVDGGQASDYLDRERFDAVLLDLMMPVLTGWEIAQRLRANPQTAAVPFAFLTAADRPEDELRGLEMGAFEFIVKPFDLGATVQLIRAAVWDLPSPTPESRQKRLESLRERCAERAE
jgi:two-component system cell cycle response regulator